MKSNLVPKWTFNKKQQKMLTQLFKSITKDEHFKILQHEIDLLK
jgi:hypothetical protein